MAETNHKRLKDQDKIAIAVGYLRDNALHTYHRVKDEIRRNNWSWQRFKEMIEKQFIPVT